VLDGGGWCFRWGVERDGRWWGWLRVSVAVFVGDGEVRRYGSSQWADEAIAFVSSFGKLLKVLGDRWCCVGPRGFMMTKMITIVPMKATVSTLLGIMFGIQNLPLWLSKAATKTTLTASTEEGLVLPPRNLPLLF